MTSLALDHRSRSGRLAFLIQWLQDRLAERRARARIADELARANDRELAELGFSRADIADIARGTYTR